MLSLKEFLARSKGKERIAADTEVFHAKDADGNDELSVEEYLASPGTEPVSETRHQQGTAPWTPRNTHPRQKHPQINPTRERVFAARDANDDEQLQFEEFMADSVAVRFAKLDGDGDSRLNHDEYLADKTDDAVVRLERDLFVLRDSDEDGHLTESEFVSKPQTVVFRIKDFEW